MKRRTAQETDLERQLHAPFVENAFYEKLLAQQASGKINLALLSVPTRLALGYYSAAKRRHGELKGTGEDE